MMAYSTTTQLITVGATICGVLITSIVTLVSQYMNRRSKENEINAPFGYV